MMVAWGGAVARGKCLEYLRVKCHWGAIIGKRRQQGRLSSQSPPTSKVHARSAERFIYGAWGDENILFKLFHNPSRLKTAAHSIVATVVLACWVLPLKLH